MASREESRLESAALIAIIGVGIAVRLLFLSRPMQLDEAYTYNEYASKPVLDGLSWYTLPNNHLFNTLLVHASTVLFGNERWSVRLPAFLAGVGLIPATFAMVARLCGRPTALLAAALVAGSEPLIDYSTNARGYTLVALITVLLVVRGQRIMADGGRARDWAWFAVLPALGFFAIPIMLYPYGGIVLWLVLASRWPGAPRSGRVRLDRLFVAGTVTALLTFICYVPAIVRTGLARVAANPYVAPRPLDAVVRELPGSLGLAWLQWNRDIPRAIAVLFVVAWAASLARRRAGQRGCAAPTGLLLTVLGWSVLAALVQRVVPYDRVWLFAQPLYAACIAAGLSGAIDRLPGLASPAGAKLRPGLAVLLGLGLASLVARGGALGPESWGTLHHGDDIARLLKPILRPDDGVIALTPCDAPLKYEFLRHRISVEYLYDYQVARARRLFVAINRPGQELAVVLAHFEVPAAQFTAPRLVRDYGTSALYELQRRPSGESGARSLSKAPDLSYDEGSAVLALLRAIGAGPRSFLPGTCRGGAKRSHKFAEPFGTDLRSSDSGRLAREPVVSVRRPLGTTEEDHCAHAARVGLGSPSRTPGRIAPGARSVATFLILFRPITTVVRRRERTRGAGWRGPGPRRVAGEATSA